MVEIKEKEVSLEFFLEGLEQRKEFVVLTLRRVKQDIKNEEDEEISLFDIQKIMSKAQQSGLQLQMEMNPLMKYVFDMDIVRIPLRVTEYEKLGRPTVGDRIAINLKKTT